MVQIIKKQYDWTTGITIYYDKHNKEIGMKINKQHEPLLQIETTTELLLIKNNHE